MSEPLIALLAAAAICWAAATLALRRIATWPGAALLAGIRLAIPVAYFLVFFDGGWTIIDDVAYFRQGRILLAEGFSPVSVFADARGMGTLLYLSDGYHFLYGWYNLAAQSAFGEYYWAPVLCNVVLTTVAAVMLAGIVRDAGASPAYARGVGVFFVLHWEVVAWSSMLNVKDLLVMVLAITMLRGLTRANARGAWWWLLASAVAAFLLLWIRFYVPLVMGIALLSTQLLQGRIRLRRAIVAAVVLALVGFVVRERIASLAGLVQLSANDLVFGTLRTLFGPVPWSLQREYGFLQVPAVLHWATLPFLVYGASRLARDVPAARLTLVFAALLIGAVAAYPELQGPRHRVQVLYVLAWAQFHGIHAAWLRWGARSSDPVTA